MFLLWLFVITCVFYSYSEENGLLHASSPGDIIIGGLLPLHKKTNRSNMPGPVSCSEYDHNVFLHTQVMIYAITEINNGMPRILPNITLGYDIYDTCGDVSLAIVATLQLLKHQSDHQSCVLSENLQSTLPEPKTKVVIGERFSEVSAAVARVVALSSLAQISYASTSEVLSNKFKFPTFLRTVPSDIYQTMAIAKLVMGFHWETVAIIGSDDEYGKYGIESLQKHFQANTCIEFITVLPSDFFRNDSNTRKFLHDVVENIKVSYAEAIIMFTKEVNVNIIMEDAIKNHLNRTWIASDSWSTSTQISEMTGIELAGQVFGIVYKRNEVPGFKDYVKSNFSGPTNAFLSDYYQRCSNQQETDVSKSTDCRSESCLNPSCLVDYIDQDDSYNMYLAVQVIVEGLRRLCNNHQCGPNTKFTALELLTQIQKVNFTVNTTHIEFDTNGDPSLGYDVLYWNMTGPNQSRRIITIGEYWPNGTISVPPNLVTDVNVTIYNCSKTCNPGQEFKVQDHVCCRQCVPCADGEVSPGGSKNCEPCGQLRYSTLQRDECLNKTVEFLNWSDAFSIILISFGALGILVSILFAVLFMIYRRTPIVKAVGGYLCFLELFSLLICFCLTFSFMGMPTDTSCSVGLPIFGIAFSVCISCILANLLQISVGFNFDLKTRSWIKKLNQPIVVVTIVSGIQVALCALWLYYYHPFSKSKIESYTILWVCDTGSNRYFIATLCYNAFLALICFLFAFKGKQLPDLYKNASLIRISMLLYLVIWVIFNQIYLNLSGKYKPAIISAAILTSSYSVVGCHLTPKCYIIVFRKEINNESAITEYIRKHYERKRMAVVTS